MPLRRAFSSLAPAGAFMREFVVGFALRTIRDIFVGLALGAVAGAVSYAVLQVFEGRLERTAALLIGALAFIAWLVVSRPAAARAGASRALRTLGIGRVVAEALVGAAFPDEEGSRARIPITEIDRRIRAGAASAISAVAPRWMARPLAWAVGSTASRAVLRRIKQDPTTFDSLDAAALRERTAQVIEEALAWYVAGRQG